MPLINDYRQVKGIYREAAELGVALPVFCAEDRETLEAILGAALEFGNKIGVADLPIIPAWTCRYPPRGQMRLVTACGDPILGTELMFSDLNAFAGKTSPYRKLRIMPHLDHAFPWLDGDVLLNYAEKFASVMCDASEKSFAENIRLTADYIAKVRGKVVVEGAVDEIFESGGKGEKNELTTAEQALKFLKETGVDIIVPNVGTEHRATGDKAVYNSVRAREISSATGKIMCLHGTSSVNQKDLHRLPLDGFVKINIYTTLAVSGGQALATQVLSSLENIFDEKQLDDLVNRGILSQDLIKRSSGKNGISAKPKLDFVTNPKRRDAWHNTVKKRCQEFMEIFNYGKYAG